MFKLDWLHGGKKKKIFLNYDASIKSFREKKQKKTKNYKLQKIKDQKVSTSERGYF